MCLCSKSREKKEVKTGSSNLTMKFNLPRLASYVCMYSDVINCDTNAVLPTPESPNNTTRYL